MELKIVAYTRGQFRTGTARRDARDVKLTDGRLEFVVAAHNEQRAIAACVGALLEIPQAWRVTVMDDASTDETAQVVRKIADSRLRLISVPYRSRARALNTAFELAEAEYLCVVDADVRFVESHFDPLLNLLCSVPFLMLRPVSNDTDMQEVDLDVNFRSPSNAFLFSRLLLPGLRFAEVYPRVGGEDTDLAIRLLKAGVRVAVVPGGYVHDRVLGPMGWRRRWHFHLWNLVTYLRHLDVPMCRRRIVSIIRQPFGRVVRSVREELGYTRVTPKDLPTLQQENGRDSAR